MILNYYTLWSQVMSTLAAQLVACALHVTKRDWPVVSSYWKKWFEVDYAENCDAMTNFAMGVLERFHFIFSGSRNGGSNCGIRVR